MMGADLSWIDLSPYFSPPDPIGSFLDAAAAFGLLIEHVLQDEQIHRVKTTECRNGSKAGWYVHYGQAAVFGNWRTDAKGVWHSWDFEKLSSFERANIEKKIAESRRRAEQARQEGQETAASEAIRLLEQASLQTHEYLAKKGFPEMSGPVLDGALLISRHDADGSVRSLQRIYRDGTKMYLKGGQAKGTFHLIDGRCDTHYVVEGYATGLSVATATGCEVYVAFDAGNLVAVAKVARARHPHGSIIIAADNDQWKDYNAGVVSGQAAADAVNGECRFPTFSCTESQPTDWNDLHQLEGINAVKAGLTPASPAYPVIWINDVKPHVRESSLIRGLLKPASMVVTYGESNSGKTFHVLDRDLCLAAGRHWYERELEPGFVVYVAAEGAHSVENRIYAYRHRYLQECSVVRFALMPTSINLLRPDADARPIVEFIRRLEDKAGIGCTKVTIDTLARAMAGGNENSSEDMGALVANADFIREQIGCCFEFVHHSGKDTAKGARGHSSLRAATDTEIEVTNSDGYHIAKVTKQRDFDIGSEFAYRLDVVELGKDSYEHPVTTCVPVWNLAHEPEPTRAGGRLGEAERKLLQAVRDVILETKILSPRLACPHPPKDGQWVAKRDQVMELLSSRGGLSASDNPNSERSARKRAVDKLVEKGVVAIHDEWMWLGENA